jgi:hypothetical protein
MAGGVTEGIAGDEKDAAIGADVRALTKVLTGSRSAQISSAPSLGFPLAAPVFGTADFAGKPGAPGHE